MQPGVRAEGGAVVYVLTKQSVWQFPGLASVGGVTLTLSSLDLDLGGYRAYDSQTRWGWGLSCTVLHQLVPENSN